MRRPPTSIVVVPGRRRPRPVGIDARSAAYPNDQNSSAATNHMMENSVSAR
jgi:hypothetical protein